MVRTRRANRYCVDCGARLVYYPRLSNPKAPNEHRVLVYACPDCTDDFEKPKMFSIKRNQVEDPLETVEIEITQLQKKVALAKWLSIDSKVIFIDEPTRGVDVGAKIEIYNLINEVAKKGVGVVVISSDMPEIMGIADRILVMYEGTFYGELTKEEFSEENILRYSIGKSLKQVV